MRLFVAVVPPLKVREAALREVRSLPWRGRVRWLPPRNVHLTLKFLGETSETEMAELHEALRTVCGQHPALDLGLRGAGAFPSVEKARVLWMGVGEGSERLRELAREIEEALESLGFERERRPFRPHTTVGRARDRGAWLEAAGREVEVGPLRFRTGSVELVRSQLSREGAVYSTVASYPLQAGGPSQGLDNGEERSDGHQDKEKYQDHGD